MGLGVFRIESQGLPMSGRCLIEFSRPAQHDAQIVVVPGEIGKDFQYPPPRMGVKKRASPGRGKPFDTCRQVKLE